MAVIALGDLVHSVGRDLGVTGWVLITQKKIDTFAAVTGDHQWIHTDVERSRSGPFGTTIAHGYLTLALVSSFLSDLLQVPDAGLALNYGLDRVNRPGESGGSFF